MSKVKLIPAIHFPGNCAEAIQFYKGIGAIVNEVCYAKDAPKGHEMPELPPNFVMHSEIVLFNTTFAMTDGPEEPVPYGNFSFMVTLDTAEQVTEVFNKFADGGKTTQPLEKQWWSSWCGEVVDRFGVTWWVGTDECEGGGK